MLKLFRLNGPLAVRFLFTICLLLVLSSFADAGFRKRGQRKASSCGTCASATTCTTGNCGTPTSTVRTGGVDPSCGCPLK